jgi:hypothetical protein
MAFTSDDEGEGAKGASFFATALAAAGFVLRCVPFGFTGALDRTGSPRVLDAFLRNSLI